MAVEVVKEVLNRILTVAVKATSQQFFVPVLSHVCFLEGMGVVAFNDVQSVYLPLDGVEASFAVPGVTLLKLVSSAGEGKRITLEFDDADSSVRAKFGRTNVKLPAKGEEDFVFRPLEVHAKKAPGITCTNSLLSALSSALFSVGDDPSRPSTVVITLDIESRCVFSTDNFTVSRFDWDSDGSRPKGYPETLLIPPLFVDLLFSVSQLRKDDVIQLHFIDEVLCAQFSSGAQVTTKLSYDADPLDFHKLLSGLESSIAVRFDIPVELLDAVQRSVIVMDTAATSTKSVVMRVSTKEMQLLSTGPTGSITDRVKLRGVEGAEETEIVVDPLYVARALKQLTFESVAASEDVLILEGPGVLHAISGISYSAS